MKAKTTLLFIACFIGLLGAASGDDSARAAAPADTKGTTPADSLKTTYRLGPEVVIEVFVWNETDLTTTAVVRPDGKISLRLIGEFVASGKTTVELTDEIQTRLRKMLTDPHVDVIVKEVKFPKIFVLGQVRKPDQYKITDRMTVLDAIALAGGFTDFSKRDVIVVRKSGEATTRIRVDVKRQIEDEKSALFYLQQGDTVYVK